MQCRDLVLFGNVYKKLRDRQEIKSKTIRQNLLEGSENVESAKYNSRTQSISLSSMACHEVAMTKNPKVAISSFLLEPVNQHFYFWAMAQIIKSQKAFSFCCNWHGFRSWPVKLIEDFGVK